MTDEPASPSQRAEARALAKKRRTKGFERREAIFDLFVSGFSHQQIAKALGVSTATVRRIVDTAVTERRLDAPERFARVQVARLTRALCALREDRRRARPLPQP
jgi:DNA-binding NarL/FixJ family response regulator